MRSATSRASLRTRLMVSVLVTLALVLAALTAGFNLVLADRLSADASNVVNTRAAAALAALRVSQGLINLPETPDQGSPDTGIWVFQGRRPIEVPQSPAATEPAVAQLAASAPATRDLPDPELRLRALPVAQHGRRVGAVVATVSLAPYAETRQTALVASVVLAALAFFAVGLGCHWLIGRALRPVAWMTRQAAEWSEHDLDRRFGLGPPKDEFSLLAATLDDLLGRLAASLRHEQRLTAELSHELRTPLAGIQAEAQHALRHGAHDASDRHALEEILAGARRMTATLEALITAARAELDPHGANSDAGTAARAAALAAVSLAAERGVRIEVAPSVHPVRVAAEQQLVERTLAPLIENACRYAETEVRIELAQSGSRTRLAVLDDGPGVPADRLETVFEPGWQGSAVPGAHSAPKGAGLGLPLARRLARHAGGDVRAEVGDPGGRFVVELPAARMSNTEKDGVPGLSPCVGSGEPTRA